MQGISKVAMGSAMVVAVCLVLVFVLLLILYVELCCSFLWQKRRRWKLQTPLPTTAASGSGSASSAKPQNKSHRDDEKGGSPCSPLQKHAVSPTAAACYAHGVLQTPGSFFFATVPHAAALAASAKQGEMLGSKEVPLPSAKTSLHFIGLLPSPRSVTKGGAACGSTRDSGSSCTPEEHFVCISNPIYDGACSSIGAGDDDDGGSTPFKTPDTSPSRLEVDDGDNEGAELEDNEGAELEEQLERGEGSPTLKPMKTLPPALPLGTPAACLADGRRSLATSISATDTNRPSSSSSSNSPCTSPSW